MKINIIIQGDCLAELKKLPEESIDCCITSPPYWGLRDYGTAKWEGGDEKCNHIQKLLTHGGEAKRPYQKEVKYQYKEICKKCGAKRIDQQLGLEKTPEEYTEKLVEIFRDVKRVLKKEGTCWLNLGDSYSSHKDCKSVPQTIANNKKRGAIEKGKSVSRDSKMLKSVGLKNKDLVGIPWRVAFALQKDGWYLRQDIIWNKPNPMPESVTDRCTKSHEYIFLLTKSPKYYFDNEAIKEKSIDKESYRGMRKRPKYIKGYPKEMGENNFDELEGKKYPTRNKRSVWTITTRPYSEAHFATFPEHLIEPMVMAGCPKEGIVLDIFMGAGTTGLVAKKLKRNWLGIELNPEYIKIAEKRIKGQTPPLF